MTNTYQVYTEYKCSGEDWLGNVPSHWDVVKIKHLSMVKRGASPRPIEDQKYFDENGEYAWTRIADVTASETYLDTAPQKLSDLGSSLSIKLEPGSLFLSIAGTVGKPCITAIKACIHDGFVYFPELKIPNKFLFYVFAGEQAYKGLGKFGTQLNLNTDTVGDIKIGCGSKNELNKIVNFLDHETAKIDTLIEKQQQLIKLLKEKRQAVISHAVTKGLNPDAPMRDSGVEWLGKVPKHWLVSRAKYVSDIFIPQRNKPVLNETQGLCWVTMEEMKRPEIEQTKLYVDDNALREANSKPLKVGAVIASCVGNFGVVSINKVAVVINQQLQAFIPKSIKAAYLRELVSTSIPYFELVGTSATLIYVNQQGFENLPVLVPPKDEQDEICIHIDKELDRYNKLVTQCDSAIGIIKERRTALISAAVTGKIDVRNWQPAKSSTRDKQEATA